MVDGDDHGATFARGIHPKTTFERLIPFTRKMRF